MTSFGKKKHRPTRTGEENKIQTQDFLNREEEVEGEYCMENILLVEEGGENIALDVKYFTFHEKSLLSKFWLD